jgi:hypothetical protein
MSTRALSHGLLRNGDPYGHQRIYGCWLFHAANNCTFLATRKDTDFHMSVDLIVRQMTSGLPRRADNFRAGRHFSFEPTSDEPKAQHTCRGVT